MKTSKLYYTVLVLSVFLIQGSLNGINPQVASFAVKFSELPLTTIMLIATIPCLTCIPANLLSGVLVSKFRIKGTLILGLVVFLVGGIAPLLSPDNLSFILFSRAILGVGYGIVYPLGATLVAAKFSGQEQAKMMGFGTMFLNVGVISFALVGAALASVSLNLVWFVHLIMGIALVLAIFMEEPESASVPEKQNVDTKSKQKISTFTWFLIAFLGLVVLFFYPIYIYSSSIISKYQLGTATDASFLITVTAIAGGIGAAAFGSVYGKIGKKLLSLGALMEALGSIILVFATNMMHMYIAGALISLGFFWLFSVGFVIIAEITPPAIVPSANGYLVAVMNSFAFLAAYILTFISNIMGREGDLRFPFIIATVFFLIASVGFLPYKAKEKIAEVENAIKVD